MVVENVAGAEIIPATGVVDQTGWIPGLEEIRDSNGIILPPTFIENDPHHDAGMIAVSVYHGLHFFLDLSGLIRRPRMIGTPSLLRKILRRRKILPHQETEFIPPSIPTLPFYLYVFPPQVAPLSLL